MDKMIEKMVREMLEISVNANVEPVLEINGKEIVLSENSTIILNNILEQAFIPYIAEHLAKKDYRKQVQGEWIPTGKYYVGLPIYKCSKCNRETETPKIDYYCPNCSAKMKGAE